MARLTGRQIVLGITGSISAYKAAEVVRALVQEKADVRVTMTKEATQFVGPMTFSALTGHPVAVEQFPAHGQPGEEHIDLATWADVVAIVPATANIIGKVANGLADDLLSTVLIACEAPCCLAPAMNFRMLKKPAVQANMDVLRHRGCHIIESTYGPLANGEIGEGRLADPEQIIEAIALLADARQDLTGRRVLISAGPTIEAIDPVRYITNRSSGKMGFAVARMAAQRGGAVTLITGPTNQPDPYGVTVERVQSAEEMHQAVFYHLDGQDAVVLAAAVADYRPRQQADQKIKKGDMTLSLEMERTRDILKEVAQNKPPALVGFAVETQNGLQYAKQKLIEKNLDLVVYNDITIEGAGFDVDTNIVTLLHKDGREEILPKQLKMDVADRIMDEVVALLHAHEPVLS
jgi:phosphopantothenoylcysteine decarboxylase / phosphopantothenate---cysteine ligase